MNNTALEAGLVEYQGIIPQDIGEQQFIALWLKDKADNTRKAYRKDIDMFLTFVQKPLLAVTLVDLYAYRDSMTGVRQATINRRLAAVKALLTFANDTGVMRFNVGKLVKLEKVDNDRATRIISETDVVRMIDREPNQRNHALLHLMYHAGLRLSEVVGLKWTEVGEREQGGQVSILGKGAKRRHILISKGMYAELMALPRKGEYVFASRQSDHLTVDAVSKMVHVAATRVGLSTFVSPHWLRHSHASHATDHGAPVSLVKETLGHESLATTSIYIHARPGASSSQFLSV
jgi:site-specific recombinase XerD